MPKEGKNWNPCYRPRKVIWIYLPDQAYWAISYKDDSKYFYKVDLLPEEDDGLAATIKFEYKKGKKRKDDRQQDHCAEAGH
jgi:hypothetical protein